ncbi:uncharacterized protein N7473_002413 [Penicillium subrubescens]|uniref:DUF2278 family protein n=1 Tax=Penicillium subrubescens TaxID=1316194 RepID=A0A1Q5UJZ6_9EURO|nr:uncharacterized protein N7473_002413 [Penicillium subrubescens]KAJ5905497.1 hypothetical protein N7473_002413 [Penicillium subrubescens]OKP12792.1 hypothetical protein PENSUB_1524 [Penicillium subrubescens]
MTISHYGVWVCQPTHYAAETEKQDSKSPHIYLYFTDDSSSSRKLEAAINVKSTDKDTRLVFWLNRNFSHPITEQLSNLEQGFHLTQSNASDNSAQENYSQDSSRHQNHGHHHKHGNRERLVRRQESTLQGLDFVRTKNIVDIESGQVLPHDIPGPNNDILDKLDPILTDAINKKATAYIFGSSYGSGIHDVHMNQGSLPNFNNGIYEDGALLFKFDDGHWEAVFLAFASQKIPTDDQGEAQSNSKSLADILRKQ